MPSKRDVPDLLRDIIDSIDDITEFVTGMDYDAYVRSRMVTAAVERKLLIISEAAVRLGDRAAELCPTQNWSAMRGIGNVLRHNYEGVDDEVVWDAVRTKLPDLRRDVVAMMVADFNHSKLGRSD